MTQWGQKRIIGLDIDENSCIACELGISGGKVSLLRSAVAAGLKELSEDESFSGREAVINFPGQIMLFRSFHLVTSLLKSKNKQKDIEAFLSRQNLPFKLEECFWGNFTLDGNFNFIAAKKEVLERYITQAQNAGFTVLGVTPSLVALYNVFIYTHPERLKDRFALLNIKTASSDLLIYEAKRLWAYPLSIGRRDFSDSQQGRERFSIETHSIFNAHYLQFPRTVQNAPNYLYLSGQGSLEELSLSLKNVLSDFEVALLDASKKINALGNPVPGREGLNLCLGLGLSYLKAGPCIKVNLIEGKVRKERFLAQLELAKKVLSSATASLAVLLLFWNFFLIAQLRRQANIDKGVQFQLQSVLPELKRAKEEKEKLRKLSDFLENKVFKQGLYLKALAAISQTRPTEVAIKEFTAQMKGQGLEVFLAGSAPGYQQINDFLSRLKKNEELKEVKVVASSFSSPEAQIDFKLRFDATDARIKPEEARAPSARPKRAIKGASIKEERIDGSK